MNRNNANKLADFLEDKELAMFDEFRCIAGWCSSLNAPNSAPHPGLKSFLWSADWLGLSAKEWPMLFLPNDLFESRGYPQYSEQIKQCAIEILRGSRELSGSWLVDAITHAQKTIDTNVKAVYAI